MCESTNWKKVVVVFGCFNCRVHIIIVTFTRSSWFGKITLKTPSVSILDSTDLRCHKDTRTLTRMFIPNYYIKLFIPFYFDLDNNWRNYVTQINQCDNEKQCVNLLSSTYFTNISYSFFLYTKLNSFSSAWNFPIIFNRLACNLSNSLPPPLWRSLS